VSEPTASVVPTTATDDHTRLPDLTGHVVFGQHTGPSRPLVHVVDPTDPDAVPASWCSVTPLENVSRDRPAGRLCAACAALLTASLFPRQRGGSPG
jgi:hypothetical protein